MNAVEIQSATARFALVLGGAILTFFFLLVALSELLWLVKVPIQVWVLPTAGAGAGGAAWWAARRFFPQPWRMALGAAVLLALLVFVSAEVSAAFYDVSFDGQAYQQEGVHQLAKGWNPLYTPYIDPISIDQNVKLIHYPKGPWIVGAAMYRLTGRMESAKFADLVLMVAAFCLVLAVLARGRLSAWSVALAALGAANPVALCQVFTFYVDGQLASLLGCITALCFLCALESNPWLEVLLFEAAVLTIQVKFTGLIYVTIFLAGYLGLLAWRKRPWRRPLCIALLALGLGTCVFGKNPYVANTFENGHPFYPFLGRGDFPKISMTSTTPPNFLGRNRAVNLAASIFSKSWEWPPQSTLKAPWQIDGAEWAAFEEPDALVGGFGPLFAAALVLSLALLGVAWWRGSASAGMATAVMGMLVISVLPVSACWWARYAPQIWLVPLVALAAVRGVGELPPPAPGREAPTAGRDSAMRWGAWLAIFVLAVNVAGIERVNLRTNREATQQVADALEDLQSHAPFKVALGNFRSNRFRLEEAHIPFIEDENHLRCDAEVKENDDLCIERFSVGAPAPATR